MSSTCTFYYYVFIKTTKKQNNQNDKLPHQHRTWRIIKIHENKLITKEVAAATTYIYNNSVEELNYIIAMNEVTHSDDGDTIDTTHVVINCTPPIHHNHNYASHNNNNNIVHAPKLPPAALIVPLRQLDNTKTRKQRHRIHRNAIIISSMTTSIMTIMMMMMIIIIIVMIPNVSSFQQFHQYRFINNHEITNSNKINNNRIYSHHCHHRYLGLCRVLKLHATSKSNSKTTSSTTAAENNNKIIDIDEKQLLQILNNMHMDIIQSSKERYSTAVVNDSNNNDDDEYYYNQQKSKLIQMLNTLYIFQLNNNYYDNNDDTQNSNIKAIYIEASRIIDQSLRHCTNEAFQLYYRKKNKKRENKKYNTYPFISLWKQIQFGLDVMDLQLLTSSKIELQQEQSQDQQILIRKKKRNIKVLSSPYDTIPQSVCLQALKALNELLMKKRQSNYFIGTNSCNKNDVENQILGENNLFNSQIQQSNTAFRILQRLCTGKGIRFPTNNNGNKKPPSKVQINLDERDFNMVLNGFVNTNQMNKAHRVIALQVRTPHAPPLSPVTYSILIKGYGNLKDVRSVELCMKQSYDHGIYPDIIMYNSLIDAYVNCGEVQLAYYIFEFLTKQGHESSYRPPRYFGSEEQPYQLYGKNNAQNSKSYYKDDDDDEENFIPPPNIRTYNIMLKGFVKDENIEEAMKLSSDMKRLNLWDDITTNTLVSVAVASNDFNLAESILNHHTNYANFDQKNNADRKSRRRQQHPNVEAYTELLDGYAKANQLNKALSILKLMRERSVNPNEYTYTCMIGALAKAQKLDQAEKLLDFMANNDGIRPGVVTYNAFLTGMLEKYIIDDKNNISEIDIEAEDLYFNERADRATKLFNTMVNESNTSPNIITVSTMVDALGKCKPSRIDEAKRLIVNLDENRLISSSDRRICTALIRGCANSLDLDGMENTYKRIHEPDTIAFNALIEGYCRCGKIKKALEIIADNNDTCREGGRFVTPDVVTYTILISAVLKIGTSSASQRALLLYNEMKRIWGITPDKALIDV